MTKNFDFTILNKIAKKHGIVLFGSTSTADIPINELVQDYEISQNIYNRSISGLKLADAEKYLNTCVYNLEPDKIILNLGEEDLKTSDEINKLIEQYRWLLYTIHTVLPDASLILTSVTAQTDRTDSFNRALKTLAAECGCNYLEIPTGIASEEYNIRFFRTIKSVFYDSTMSYSDIIQYCAI